MKPKNNYVISQHLLDKPHRIDDLPGQTFIQSVAPIESDQELPELFREPEQMELKLIKKSQSNGL